METILEYVWELIPENSKIFAVCMILVIVGITKLIKSDNKIVNKMFLYYIDIKNTRESKSADKGLSRYVLYMAVTSIGAMIIAIIICSYSRPEENKILLRICIISAIIYGLVMSVVVFFLLRKYAIYKIKKQLILLNIMTIVAYIGMGFGNSYITVCTEIGMMLTGIYIQIIINFKRNFPTHVKLYLKDNIIEEYLYKDLKYNSNFVYGRKVVCENIISNIVVYKMEDVQKIEYYYKQQNSSSGKKVTENK